MKSCVKELREKKGLSQVALAALTGVSVVTVRNWEQANGLELLRKYYRAAIALGCSIEDLIEIEEDDRIEQEFCSIQELKQIIENSNDVFLRG